MCSDVNLESAKIKLVKFDTCLLGTILRGSDAKQKKEKSPHNLGLVSNQS